LFIYSHYYYYYFSYIKKVIILQKKERYEYAWIYFVYNYICLYICIILLYVFLYKNLLSGIIIIVIINVSNRSSILPFVKLNKLSAVNWLINSIFYTAHANGRTWYAMIVEYFNHIQSYSIIALHFDFNFVLLIYKFI